MKIAYFPGCTLETKAVGFDRSARQVAAALGLELITLPDWNCCGASFPLSTDNVLDLIGPMRNLVNAAEAGENILTVSCATCFNVLRRTNYALRHNPETLEKANFFLERPTDYRGQVEIRHLLDVFVNTVGLEVLRQRTCIPLHELRVACYYGCMLLRPADEIGLDDVEHPRIMDRLFEALGATVVDHPHKGECCGAYVTVHSPAISVEMTRRVLVSALVAGADVIVTACPLCQFNLDWLQVRMASAFAGLRPLPILYFTQLMGLAMGFDASKYDLDRHNIDPRPLLMRAGLMEQCVQETRYVG